MRAKLYNRREIEAGRLTPAHINALKLGTRTLESAVRSFQRRQGLIVDGKAGPRTRAALLPIALPERCWPVIGDAPIITSPYGPRTSGFHKGVDLYPAFWGPDDPESPAGYRFRSGRRKGERWVWYPPGTELIHASADGVVKLCGTRRNGYRYWIQHVVGATGYLHLDEDTAWVDQGAAVMRGQPLAKIDLSLRDPHLHFEFLMTISPYRPVDPAPWLKGCRPLLRP